MTCYKPVFCVVLVLSFALSGCVGFGFKKNGKGLESTPHVVLPVPQSGQIPIR